MTGRKRMGWPWPHQDHCLWSGLNASCDRPALLRREDTPCDASVGATGWLRACRRAYVEGVSVLYGTNSFMIESRDLLDALLQPNSRGCVLPARHLSMIRSLEIRSEVVLFGEYRVKRAIPRKIPDFSGLAGVFSSLQFLILSFPDTLHSNSGVRRSARIQELIQVMLEPIARASAPLAPQQRHSVVVEVPENVMDDLLSSGEFDKENLDPLEYRKSKAMPSIQTILASAVVGLAASATAQRAPPTTTMPNIYRGCNWYYVATAGDTCETAWNAGQISADQFYAWNPDVSRDCRQNFWVGYSYCVGV
ncbi:uncharacterized protein B0I36DRAFT_388191 [Microdochium trichocladiopsis]|uniref:LysM domain-containing protein n=1 Tax=Microdochium trichocladiopsis TaxID=1682393 RepID=A0A9P8XZN3_9PEZI|nr:uncharacterized protein B0I36DRAFT_388191 [Microdochium trichocladiopsis]KAH7021503.1 hypothetical protein B0I36DRAFT_388191 [Microdochium trichocladiopsis]